MEPTDPQQHNSGPYSPLDESIPHLPVLFLVDPFLSHPPAYASVSVVSIIHVLQLKFCMHFSPLTHATCTAHSLTTIFSEEHRL
jgi:hypothetical protein